MPASSMIIKVDGPIASAQSGSSPCCRDQVSLARASLRIRSARRERRLRQPTGQAEHLTADLGPGQGQGTQCSRPPGAGGGNRELQTCLGGTHLADLEGLPSIQCSAVRRHLQQGQPYRQRDREIPAAIDARIGRGNDS